jgi:prophage antirepressor-like protein
MGVSSNIVPFKFEGEPVRVVQIDGEPWFVGRDVALGLGYADPTNAVKQHCRGVAKLYPLRTGRGMRDVRILSEPDVLRLVVGSNLPAAKRFERWVFEEVLPSVRKTGGYDGAAPLGSPDAIVTRGEAAANEAPPPALPARPVTAHAPVHVPPEANMNLSGNVVPFSFDGVPVRVLARDGEPWFVLADVCRVLEIKNVGDASGRLDDDEKGSIANPDATSAGGKPTVIIINESGLYSLILTSRKPEAKRFKKWVTSEVLPAIRKTGGYIAATPEETPETIMARALFVAKETMDRQAAQLIKAEERAVKAEQIVERERPKVEAHDRISAADGSLTITQAVAAERAHGSGRTGPCVLRTRMANRQGKPGHCPAVRNAVLTGEWPSALAEGEVIDNAAERGARCWHGNAAA